MTHIPNCDKESGRRGKLATACGREISVRKIVTDNASCPHCSGLDDALRELVFRGEETIMEYVDRYLDRGALIRVGRVFGRRRWRK